MCKSLKAQGEGLYPTHTIFMPVRIHYRLYTSPLPPPLPPSPLLSLPLPGERMTAQEALSAGLVSKVFAPGELVEEAIKLGERVSGFSKITVAMAKEAVNAAEQLPLNEGTLYTITSLHIMRRYTYKINFDLFLQWSFNMLCNAKTSAAASSIMYSASHQMYQ